MDFKNQSQNLKNRAKELGYDIKLTHAQELTASILGHKSRHSALLESKHEKMSNKLIVDKLEPLLGKPNPGMIINSNCQCCQKRPRVRAHYHWSGNPQIWLLCEECIRPSSKFSLENGCEDVTNSYDLNATYLRDILFENGDSSPVKKAFMFRLICLDGTLGDRYMFVPGLWSGHSEVKVWNMDKNKEANGWWDWSIIVLPNS